MLRMSSGDHPLETLELCLWSREVILFTNESADGAKAQELSAIPGVRLVTGKISGLQSVDGVENQLRAVLMENGGRIACHALFFSPHQALHSSLARRLDCRVDGSSIGCDSDGGTVVPGLFIAENVTKGIQMAIVAASEGLVTAAINNWLMDFDASHPA